MPIHRRFRPNVPFPVKQEDALRQRGSRREAPPFPVDAEAELRKPNAMPKDSAPFPVEPETELRKPRGMPTEGTPFPVEDRTPKRPPLEGPPFPAEKEDELRQLSKRPRVPEGSPPPAAREQMLNIRPKGMVTDFEPSELVKIGRALLAKNVRISPDGMSIRTPIGGRKKVLTVAPELRADRYSVDIIGIDGGLLGRSASELIGAWDWTRKCLALLSYPHSQQVGVITPIVDEVVPNLRVTDPDRFTVLRGLNTHAITWETLGGTPVSFYANVKIELWKDDSFKLELKDTIANSTQTWTWPLTAQLFELQADGYDLLGIGPGGVGQGYRIRISALLNDFYYDESDEEFWIVAPRIAVLDPDSTTYWQKTTYRYITWFVNLGANHATNVKIELFKGGVFQATIVGSTPTWKEGTWTSAPVYAGGQTTLYDSATTFPADTVGRALQPDVNYPDTFTIVAGGAGQVTVTGDATAVAQSGDTYRLPFWYPFQVDNSWPDGVDYTVKVTELDGTYNDKIYDETSQFTIGTGAPTANPALTINGDITDHEIGQTLGLQFTATDYSGQVNISLITNLVYNAANQVVGGTGVGGWQFQLAADRGATGITKILTEGFVPGTYAFRIWNADPFSAGGQSYEQGDLEDFSNAFRVLETSGGGGGGETSLEWQTLPSQITGSTPDNHIEHLVQLKIINAPTATLSYQLRWRPIGTGTWITGSIGIYSTLNAPGGATLDIPWYAWWRVWVVPGTGNAAVQIRFKGSAGDKEIWCNWIDVTIPQQSAVYIHVWDRLSTYGHHEIWRVDPQEGTQAAPVEVISTNNTNQVPNYDVAYATNYKTVRKMLCGQDGQLLVVFMDAMERQNGGGPLAKKLQPGYRIGDTARLIKFDETGRKLWLFDAAAAVRTTEAAATSVSILEHTAIAVSDDTGAVIVALAGYTITAGVYQRKLWVYKVDPSDGSKLAEKSIATRDAGVTIDATHDWGLCGIYGATWSEAGDFWIAADYKYADNAGTAYDPTEFTGRLYRVPEDFSTIEAVTIKAEGAVRTQPVGIAYHPDGWLLVPVFYNYDPSGFNVNRTGLVILDQQGHVAHTIGFEYDDSGNNVLLSYPHPLGGCGLERNEGISNFQINRMLNASEGGLLKPQLAWLTDGRRLSLFDIHSRLGEPRAVDVGGTMGQGTVHTFNAHGLMRAANGRMVVLSYEHQDTPSDPNDDLRLRLKVLRTGNGSTKYEVIKDLTSADAVNDPYLPQPWIAYGGPDGSGSPSEHDIKEFPWASMAVSASVKPSVGDSSSDASSGGVSL